MGEGERSRADAEENDLSGGAEENCGGAESTVGEGEKRGVKSTSVPGEGSCIHNNGEYL